ncbi:DUF5709 domain-containing protein [Streptomyces albiaxialis]|uniref:DUF5709 domain-containing protein n=1 Tax=Streptomyces albiaxialis TaxID=329523 RepID=A0ABP5I8U0_9ACTN
MSDETEDIEPAEDDGVLEPADSLLTDRLDADPLDTGILPADRWSPAESYGNTAEEAREGESLDQLLAEEEPEPPSPYADDGEDGEGGDGADPVPDEWSGGPGPRTGRLTAGDEGTGRVRDPELFAHDEGIDGGAASAEEAAVHVIEDEGAM